MKIDGNTRLDDLLKKYTGLFIHIHQNVTGIRALSGQKRLLDWE
jgi:hypothetical protein